jgi:hypothetical protein
MKNMLKLLFFVFTCFFITNCDKDGYITLLVYKTKADYSDKVTVKLSPDKDKVVGFPGPWNHDERWPMKLANGYLLHGVFGGLYTGITSLTWEEYSKYPTASLTPDSLYKLLIDKDPFLEYYSFEDHTGIFINEAGIDTARLNNIIITGELEKYFTRLK